MTNYKQCLDMMPETGAASKAWQALNRPLFL